MENASDLLVIAELENAQEETWTRKRKEDRGLSQIVGTISQR